MTKKRPNPRLTTGALVATAFTLSALSGLCASPSYPAIVQGDGALGYYRFNDSLARSDINLNSGSLGAAGNATNDLEFVTGGVVHSMPGAIVGDPDRAAFYDYTCRTEIPFNSALNTANTQPFTVEAWMYPVSDQGATGMGALCNRYTQTGNRQGWVMYQRGANTNSSAYTSGPGLGWEFRMYNDLDTGSHLDVQSLVPFTLGKWQHVVITYDPVGGDPLSAILSFYIDGVFANAVTNTTGISGYGPCTGDHSPTDAVNGQPAMSLGGYNNANSGTYGFANPWIGGVDEFAWYNTKLSPAQILAHYQNATNANRSTPYATLIKSSNPVAYLRLNEVAPGPDVSVNIGDLRSAGNATNTAAIKHPGGSALAGKTPDGSHSGHWRDGGGSFADIPWTAANNPDASVPFAIEFWAKPTADETNPGPAPINNRLANGIANRTGWVIYQRCPNVTYSGGSGESAIGWTLRTYQGNSGNSSDAITAGGNAGANPDGVNGYNVGQWMHVVFTWDPLPADGGIDNGPTPSGSEEWIGTLIVYTNGVAAATNSSAGYAANIQTPADDPTREPADLAIGSYNRASGLGEEFEGDIDEVALYTGFVMTPAQVLAHYMAGTNSHPATNYETLVMTAGGDSFLADPANVGLRIPEGTTIPKTFLRFNEPAYFPAANSGSLGYLADGALVITTNIGAGPTSPDFIDFESPNPSVPVDGVKSWASLNDPSGLNFSGQISLEAWINPAATQGATARIISHGPPTPTIFAPGLYTLSGSQLSSNEVFLRIEFNSGVSTNYVIGTSDGTTFHGASAPVPAGDLGGANGWIHLVGAYDGTHWNLYRNGVQIATVLDGVGALPVSGAEWAIGATGMGWGDFFTGGIDEVAIYDPPLNPVAVWAHYYAAKHGRAGFNLTIDRPAGVTTVHWPAGTLQNADNLTGPWTDLVGAVGPTSYNPPAGPTKKYYRVKL